jgi:hypothetical protein
MPELLDERDAWLKVMHAPKGPGFPSNAARDAAERLHDEAAAWYFRRLQEAPTEKSVRDGQSNGADDDN